LEGTVGTSSFEEGISSLGEESNDTGAVNGTTGFLRDNELATGKLFISTLGVANDLPPKPFHITLAKGESAGELGMTLGACTMALCVGLATVSIPLGEELGNFIMLLCGYIGAMGG
jgi:hypothetical protein